ncbi:hypothetical protein [Pedobacter sp. ASV12]|uniref:hypothetical protein n=1 Tax=Pedobacter sp. ASV12 TaxID=2795120 RepID=UPI0018EDB66D|nr:hypothetical protein [Pedobacter sp. ASV12]
MEKKHLTLIIAVLVIAFGAYVYYYPPTRTDSRSPRSRPSTLRFKLIEEMVDNYRQTQLKAIENAGASAVPNDANSILFDLDTLKKFINDIESIVAAKQPDGGKKLAIRMYYAAYPSNTKWAYPGYEDLGKLLGNDITRLYEKKHTLILLPAIRNKRGVYADFNPLDLSTYEGFKKRSLKQMSFIMVKDERSDEMNVMALNHGQIIPPATVDGQAFQ